MGQSTSLTIFDCDGVLVDSEPIMRACLVVQLRQAGIELDSDSLSSMTKGQRLNTAVSEAARRIGALVPGDFWSDFGERVLAEFERHLRPIPGVIDAIHEIPGSSCVASNGSLRRILKALELVGLESHFSGRVFSASAVPRSKPHPDLFLYAARRMSASPHCCIVVEDSAVGAEAAKRAGMAVLGFSANSDAWELQRAGATTFDDMRDLPHLVAAKSREKS